MVADMELSAAEIETLRTGMTLWATAEDRRLALAILDRLSPPAPEVDEATRIWREMEARGCEAVGGIGSAQVFREGGYDDRMDRAAEISYLRQAISELIASKDAERADLARDLECTRIREKNAGTNADVWRKAYNGAITRAEKAESELAALRAENERLKDTIADLGVDLDEWQRCERAAGNIPSPKAAERNTAEPTTDTAPVVEVTEGDRNLEILIRDIRQFEERPAGSIRIDMQDVRSILSLYDTRTEAEARGRRQALEAATARLEWYRQYGAGMINQRGFAASLIVELKRLMTEGK